MLLSNTVTTTDRHMGKGTDVADDGGDGGGEGRGADDDDNSHSNNNDNYDTDDDSYLLDYKESE